MFLDCAISEEDPIKHTGGIPQRTIGEIFGKNASLKSTTTQYVMKSVLEDDKDNQVVAVYSEEPNTRMMKQMGLDFNRIHAIGCYEDEETKLKTAERQLDIVKKAVQDDSVKLVVIDSIKALCSTKQIYDKKGDIRDLDEEEQMAIRAKLIGNFIRDFTSLNRKAILLMTNQVSDKLGMTFEVGPELRPTTPGGRFMEYMAHLRIEAATKPIYTDPHPLTDKKLLKGYELWYKLVKNKYNEGLGMKSVMTEFYLNPPGFRRSEEVLRLAEFLNIVEKGGGGNFTIEGKKVRGQDNVINLLDTDIAMREEIAKKVFARRKELFLDNTSAAEANLLA